MISKRLLQLALVALSASQVAQAYYVGAVDGVVVRRDEELVKRQSSSATSASGNTPRPTPSSTPAPSPAPSSTTNNPAPSSTTNSPRPSSTTENPRPSSTTSNRPEPSSSTSTESDKTSETTTTSEQQRTTSTLPPETSTVFETVTNTDGSVSTKTSTTVNPGRVTDVPVDNPPNTNTGMAPGTRNTIIGVVVGVGGAIVLAVIGLFAWRMWGRKKAQEENDGLMDYGTPGYHPGPAEPKEPSVPGSSSVGTGRSPFQSTLESYHAPTQVNTASNF